MLSQSCTSLASSSPFYPYLGCLVSLYTDCHCLFYIHTCMYTLASHRTCPHVYIRSIRLVWTYGARDTIRHYATLSCPIITGVSEIGACVVRGRACHRRTLASLINSFLATYVCLTVSHFTLVNFDQCSLAVAIVIAMRLDMLQHLPIAA